MTTTETKKSSGWGKGVAALYIGFVLFILGCVAFASFQDFDLVESDYYAKGLAYEGQIEKLRRTQDLIEQPSVEVDAETQSFIVRFPANMAADKLSGSCWLYYPANSRYDQTHALAVGTEHTMTVPAERLPSGRWLVKLDWQYDSTEYFSEVELFLQ